MKIRTFNKAVVTPRQDQQAMFDFRRLGLIVLALWIYGFAFGRLGLGV